MKQQSDDQPNPNIGKSEVARRYTSRILCIQQRWERKRDRLIFRVYQVHRKDRKVDLVPVGMHQWPTGRDITRVSFADLRAKYRLLDKEETT